MITLHQTDVHVLEYNVECQLFKNHFLSLLLRFTNSESDHEIMKSQVWFFNYFVIHWNVQLELVNIFNFIFTIKMENNTLFEYHLGYHR